ncbi:hypothetical protein [Thermodesulfobium sp.]|jgi:hypothetical protein
MLDEINFAFFDSEVSLFCESNLRLSNIVNLRDSAKKFLEVKELCKFF